MARCDVLGGSVDADFLLPVAVMTASIAPLSSEAALEAVVMQERGDTVLDKSDADGLFLTRYDSAPPDRSFNPDHWRGVMRIGDHMIRLSLYSAADAPALGPYGRVLVEESLRFTRAASGDGAARVQ